jgi:hypothetical protein
MRSKALITLAGSPERMRKKADVHRKEVNYTQELSVGV